MNQIEIGKLIAKSRKEKGYTQQELANLLFVTDKAVSKWERGLSIPDSNIVIKIVGLLDLDIEQLIPKNNKEWVGCLNVNEKDGVYKNNLGTQTILEHQLVLFALLNIKKVFINCNDTNFIKSLRLEKFGFEIFLNKQINSNYIFEVSDNIFIFGANLSRFFENTLLLDSSIDFYFNDTLIPIKIINGGNIKKKNLGRGYIFSIINKNTYMNVLDLYETLNHYSDFTINDLHIIRKNRT